MNTLNAKWRFPTNLTEYVLHLVVVLSLGNLSLGYANDALNIRDFGAVGDGKTLDTDAINKTIASSAETGGGIVVFPPGTYLSGTVHLQSHVSIVLEAGARLLGATDLNLYQNFTPPPGKPESKWTRWHRALIQIGRASCRERV